MTNILGMEGDNNRKVERFYVSVVRAVLMFGSEIWILTPRLETALKGFHYRAARRMAGMGPKHHPDGTWLYPPIGAELAMVVLEEIGIYISRFHNMVAQYIATRPIMDLCLAVERKPGMRLSRRWWEKTAMYTMGIRVGQVARRGGGGRRGREENNSRRDMESKIGVKDAVRLIC